MSRSARIVFLAALVAVVAPHRESAAQVRVGYYDYARPDLEWYTIETEHFLVHFHQDSTGTGSGRTARVVARIAEEIYGPITSLYEHEPDTKVSFILKDYEDYSNGAAYFFDNMIEIWAPALDTPFRGDHAWLRNVISHEFLHMIQVQKTMKANRRLPFLYFQYLDYENVRRPDVLYGYPNVIATYPIPVLNNPAWLAEGTAQYQRSAMDYDRWDSHRDMLLRTQVLAGRELSLQDMGGFYSHTSLGRESVYNHGFAFSQYIAATRGEDALRAVSASLAKWSNWNFERAAKDALGIDGQALYDEWMAHLRAEYGARTEAIRAALAEGETVSEAGFLNGYPRLSPDGTKLAWVSNAGQDFSAQSIRVMDLSTEGATGSAAGGPGSAERRGVTRFDVGGAPDAGYTCSLGHRLVRTGGGAIAWKPDGRSIVYARTNDDADGHLVSDLWEVEVATGRRTRLTRGARANDPAWSPDGRSVAYVTLGDGSSNLALLDTATGTTRTLTTFAEGQQVTDPRFAPAGDWIHFAVTARRGRDLWRVRTDGTGAEAVLATPDDERTPAVSADGSTLYFASDADGIYNLYRLDLRDPAAGAERLTNVLGGAFAPEPAPGGGLWFARYDAEGFRIARLAGSAVAARPSAARYEPPALMGKRLGAELAPGDGAVPGGTQAGVTAGFDWTRLNRFDDTDARPFAASDLAAAHAKQPVPVALGTDDAQEGVLRPYAPVFTSFSFLPVLRLDRYVSRRRSTGDVRLPDRTVGETLLRNTKAGVYVASREVLPGLSMFGGALVSPASRPSESFFDYMAPSHLLKLERDVFLQFDYARGLGLLPKRWSPQFSLELFNVSRNVSSGLSIEEFPCTSCYPDTTLADLSYNLWEVDLSARSKVSRSLIVETAVRYSPYRVTTERFFSKELRQSIPESSSRYFIGSALRLWFYYEALAPHRHEDVVPEGMRVEGGFERENGRLLTRFDVEDGRLEPVYERNTFVRAALDVRAGMRLFRHAKAPHGLAVRARGTAILGPEVDDFYNDYVGGLTGARGYPFYALGGNRTAWLHAAYSFPILPDLRRQVAFLYLDKVYARVYADAAAAWSGKWSGSGGFRKDVGAELRFGLGSFYLLPTAIFASATYGLDAFDFQLDEGFLTPDGRPFVRYGRELQWHVGILFGFDLL